MVKEHGDEHAEILILGNKIDLINDRVVPEEDAHEFASDYGVSYCECSAKDTKIVDSAFKLLIGKVL